jgi:hypothetical protein
MGANTVIAFTSKGSLFNRHNTRYNLDIIMMMKQSEMNATPITIHTKTYGSEEHFKKHLPHTEHVCQTAADQSVEANSYILILIKHRNTFTVCCCHV